MSQARKGLQAERAKLLAEQTASEELQQRFQKIAQQLLPESGKHITTSSGTITTTTIDKEDNLF